MAKKKPVEDKLNDGMFYEIGDRIKCILTILESQVLDTRVINTQIRWGGLIQAAEVILQQLCEEVGRPYWMVDSPKNTEAVDRSCWLFEVINELLIEHPEVIHDAKAKRLANAAADNLWKLYQHLEAKNIIDEQKPKSKPAGKGVRKGTKRPVRKPRK